MRRNCYAISISILQEHNAAITFSYRNLSIVYSKYKNMYVQHCYVGAISLGIITIRILNSNTLHFCVLSKKQIAIDSNVLRYHALGRYVDIKKNPNLAIVHRDSKEQITAMSTLIITAALLELLESFEIEFSLLSLNHGSYTLIRKDNVWAVYNYDLQQAKIEAYKNKLTGMENKEQSIYWSVSQSNAFRIALQQTLIPTEISEILQKQNIYK